MKIFNRLLVGAIAAAVAFMPAGAKASGFQLSQASITNMSRAFAGVGVTGDDLSAAFYNPAGMTLIEKQGLQLNMTYINVASEFSGTRSGPLSGAAPMGFTDEGSATGKIQSLIPALFYVTPLSDRLYMGASLTLPFGLGTKYPEDSFVSAYAVQSDLRLLQLDVSAAYKVTDQLSLGISIGAQEGNAMLSSKPDFTYAPGPGPTLIELQADDVRLAFVFGAMYEINDSNRVGLSWRPSVRHDVTGKSDGLPTGDVDIKATIHTPDVVTLSSYHRLTDDLALTSAIKWNNWSSFESLRISPRNGGPDIQDVPFNWEDTFMYSLGLDYMLSREWMLRGGIAYSQSPIPSAKYRYARIPDNSRTFLSMGTSYKPNDRMQFDFGYTAMLIRDADVDSSMRIGGVAHDLTGEYKSDGIASLIGVAAQVYF